MKKREFWKGLLTTSTAIAMICGCVDDVGAKLSGTVLGQIANPVPGLALPFSVRPPFLNAPGAAGAAAGPVIANYAAFFAAATAAAPGDPVLGAVAVVAGGPVRWR
jgi:hypothetical protein